MERDLRATTSAPLGPAALPDQEASVTWDEWRPPPPTAARSVPLGDLLTIAGLTPAQAVLVTADLLQATAANPAERVHAVLRTDGAVDLTDEEGETPAAPLPDLLDEVVRNARRLPAHPQPHQLALLRHVEEQVGATGDPAERASALREALGEVVGVARVRRELAALVEAFNGIAVSRSVSTGRVNGHTVGMSPIVRPTPLPPHVHVPRPRQVGRRRARNRRKVAIVGALALALVIAGGYLLWRGPGSGWYDDLRGNNDNNAATTNQQPPTHHKGQQQTGHHGTHHSGTFPTLAAHSAGRVQGVTLQKINGCAPGTACGVTVTVHLTAASVSQPISWKVGVARGCTRPQTWSPVTTVTAQPGWTRVFASSSVQIPQGRSFALVALTSSPSHAQSQPIPVAGTPLHC